MIAPQTVEEARAAVEALQAEVKAEKAAGVRCTGHCCRSFTLSAPLEQIRQCIDYAERLAAGEDVPPNEVPRLIMASDDDLRTISTMVESLGQHEQNPVFTYTDHSPHRPLDFYRCRHLAENGDCGIYDRRPKLCQDYGTHHVCQYRECTGLARQGSPAARLAEAVRQLEKLEVSADLEARPGLRARGREGSAVTAAALAVALAALPLAPDNGCRCTDLDPTLAAFTRLAAAAVLASTARALTCHNGLRRGGMHEQGRAVDLVLDGTWNYRRVVAAFEAGGSTRAALSAAGQVAAWTGIRWGLAAWGSVDEVGHFERPTGVRWPAPALLLAVLPNAGGCR